MINLTKDELESLMIILSDTDIGEYIDYDNPLCPYKSLYEKIMGETNKQED
jgi:hypothetical protein